jgi:tetrahydromethanopterin S-methyltransferase subunit B
VSKGILPAFEHRSQPVLHSRGFFIRLAWSVSIGLIAISLLAGMIGYHRLEHLGWLDSFLNASMLLGGMGPLHVPVTESGKLFAGFYALYCGLAVIAVASVMLAPVAHRLLHKLHVESGGK